MTKADLRRRIQPLVDKLGDRLVAILWREISGARSRAIATATEQLRTDLEATCRSASVRTRRSAGSSTATKRSARSASARATRRRSTAKNAVAAASEVARTSAARKVVTSASTAVVATSKRVATCSKCGATGHNARTCNVAELAIDETSTPSPPPLRADRFAAIEAAAASRRAANGDTRVDR